VHAAEEIEWSEQLEAFQLLEQVAAPPLSHPFILAQMQRNTSVNRRCHQTRVKRAPARECARESARLCCRSIHPAPLLSRVVIPPHRATALKKRIHDASSSDNLDVVNRETLQDTALTIDSGLLLFIRKFLRRPA